MLDLTNKAKGGDPFNLFNWKTCCVSLKMLLPHALGEVGSETEMKSEQTLIEDTCAAS